MIYSFAFLFDLPFSNEHYIIFFERRVHLIEAYFFDASRWEINIYYYKKSELKSLIITFHS